MLTVQKNFSPPPPKIAKVKKVCRQKKMNKVVLEVYSSKQNRLYLSSSRIFTHYSRSVRKEKFFFVIVFKDTPYVVLDYDFV